jgi:long-chain fatty acid transport protein
MKILRTIALQLAIWSPLAWSAQAGAAGLSRPSIVGARAIGLGGAFTAVADDPTAIWHNPGGLAVYGDNAVYVGGELLLTDRSYTPDPSSKPLGVNGVSGTIHESTGPTAIPILGASTRFGYGNALPSRFSLGIATYSPYGGSISYRLSDIKNQGLVSTQLLDFEVTPTLAYQVSEVLFLGVGLRIGINAFSVDSFEGAHATLSGTGVGVGATLGAMVRPHPRVQIGAVYRTPLSATINGSGETTIIGASKGTPTDFDLGIEWPQSAGLGLAVRPHERILASVQADWTGWSSVQQLAINIHGAQNPTTKPYRYMDTYSVHLGLQGIITRYLLARLGWALDSNAVPDSTVRRENIDALKSTVSVGVGLHFWKLFFDTAFEAFLPLGARTVLPQVGTDNEAGTYNATVYTGELSAMIRF